MSRISGLYIDGQWGEPSGGEILELVNPATEEKSGELMLGSRVDMDRAVAAARAAFPGFAATSLATRIDLIGRIIEIYKTRFADIGESICDEMGAPLGFATRFQAG
ncbi:MAG TPA: aldehyde dehydrogenase family protein, partial [Rhizobiales bacterium]|nr:aldehyde dehydrogenase family protein [Hyphomicrobiales bacterium]